MVAWVEYKEQAKNRGALALELFAVQSMPSDNPEAVKAALPDHLAYQRTLEENGQLVMAGPISDESGDNMIGAGMIIYRAKSLDDARQLAENDPMHKSGARSFKVRKWLINEGSLNISIGLSTGFATLS